jgi:hypothetical protein
MNPDLHWMLTTAQVAKYVHLVSGHRASSCLQMCLLTTQLARARAGCAHRTINDPVDCFGMKKEAERFGVEIAMRRG